MDDLLRELYETGCWVHERGIVIESIPISENWGCIVCGSLASQLVRFDDNPSWVGYCNEHNPNE